MDVIQQMENKRKYLKKQGQYERAERMKVQIADYKLRLKAASPKG